MDEFGAQLSARARAVSDAVYEKTLDVRNNALMKAGVQPQDLSKLHNIPLIAAAVGVFINLALLMANDWLDRSQRPQRLGAHVPKNFRDVVELHGWITDAVFTAMLASFDAALVAATIDVHRFK